MIAVAPRAAPAQLTPPAAAAFAAEPSGTERSPARSAAPSPSLIDVLQNLAVGAGAVGSLQLTYISKVR